jgi:hypothetical protein
MTVAEGVGVAAALAAARRADPADVADDPAFVAAVRRELLARGAWLPPVTARPPAGPVDHPHYGAYRTMLRWGLAVGGYENEPRLDAPLTRTGLLYLMANVMARVHGDAGAGQALIARHGLADGPLPADTAAAIVADALCLVDRCPDGRSWPALRAAGLELDAPAGGLTRGEVYALATLLTEGATPHGSLAEDGR